MANVARIQELLERGRSLPTRAPELPADPTIVDYATHHAHLASLYADLAIAFHQTLPLIVEEVTAVSERLHLLERERAKKLPRRTKVTPLRGRT